MSRITHLGANGVQRVGVDGVLWDMEFRSRLPEVAGVLPRWRRRVRQPTDADTDAWLRAVPVDVLRRVVDGLPIQERRLVWLLRQEPRLSTETIADYLGVRASVVTTMREGVAVRVQARLRAFGWRAPTVD